MVSSIRYARQGEISIIDVIRMAKAEARNMKESTVTKYFTLDSQGMERFLYKLQYRKKIQRV